MRHLGPPLIPDDQLLVIGETSFRNIHRRFGLLPLDRLRHVWIVGKTGSGKSTLLENLIIQDLEGGNGLAVLDPHGALVDRALSFVPARRRNHLLFLSPKDRDHPIAFNPFLAGGATDPALVAGQLLSVFRRHFHAFWGPRLEHVLRNGILAVAATSRPSLITLYRFLTDEKYRERFLPALDDPLVVAFWKTEFPGYGSKLQAESLSPILNKLGAFLSSPNLRNIVGGVTSKVDLPGLMNTRGIMLAHLSPAELGEDGSHLVGGLILSSLLLAALGRPSGSPPFFIYADEFQNFVSDSVATMLSEARKFGLGLTLAHQYLGQLGESVRHAVIGNVGTKIVFRLGSDDAAELEPHLTPFTTSDLELIPAYHMVVRQLARGYELPAFSARSLPPTSITVGEQARERILHQSRQRFGASRAIVEERIRKSLTEN